MLQNEAVCPSVRIFGDFYEGDMDPVSGLLPTGTLTKKISLGPGKNMHKLGLAGNTGIGRDPFSDLFWSHFLHFFALFLKKVRARRKW